MLIPINWRQWLVVAWVVNTRSIICNKSQNLIQAGTLCCVSRISCSTLWDTLSSWNMLSDSSSENVWVTPISMELIKLQKHYASWSERTSECLQQEQVVSKDQIWHHSFCWLQQMGLFLLSVCIWWPQNSCWSLPQILYMQKLQGKAHKQHFNSAFVVSLSFLSISTTCLTLIETWQRINCLRCWLPKASRVEVQMVVASKQRQLFCDPVQAHCAGLTKTVTTKKNHRTRSWGKE